MNPRLVTGVLLAVDALLVLVATKGWAQDFLPYYTGATLVLHGRPELAMLPPDATSLMDGTSTFLATAEAISGVEQNRLSGLVTAPPALVPAVVLAALPYGIASTLWKLLGALSCAAALHGLHQGLPEARKPSAAWIALLLLPGMAWCVLLGQTTPLLAAAAGLSAVHPRAAGVFLGLAGVFKLSPLVLLLQARRAVRNVAIPVVALLVGFSLVLPLDLWPAFRATALHLSSHTTPTPENVSLEAGLLRWTLGPTADLVPISPAIWAAGAVVRLAAAAVFARALYRRAGTRGAGWVLALWMTPLSWGHYLVVLPFAAERWRVLVALVVALPHVAVFLRPPWLGTLGTLASLVAGTLVLVASWRAEPTAG